MSEFSEALIVSEAFVAVMDYSESKGATNLKDVEGCWESQVDEHWWIALNGHPELTECSRSGIPVPSYYCYATFNGWPAAKISAFGGWIAAGELANEDSFIAALKAATVKT